MSEWTMDGKPALVVLHMQQGIIGTGSWKTSEWHTAIVKAANESGMITNIQSLLKAFRIEVRASSDTWRVLHEETNNYQRLVRIPLRSQTQAVRLVPTATWGTAHVRLFAFEVS